MKKNDFKNEIIARLGYFRNKRNLSAREVSLRLGHTESWFYRIENGEIDLKLSILYDLMELLEITPTELFYYDHTKYKEDEDLLSLIQSMSKDEKDTFTKLIKMKR